MSYETQQTNDGDDSSIDQHEEIRQRWEWRIDDSSLNLGEEVTAAALADEFGALDDETIEEICNEVVMVVIHDDRSTATLDDFREGFERVDDDPVEDVEPVQEAETSGVAEVEESGEQPSEDDDDLDTVDVVESHEETAATEDSDTRKPARHDESAKRVVELRQHAELEREVEQLQETVATMQKKVPLMEATLRRLLGGNSEGDSDDVTPVFEFPGLAEDRLDEREQINNRLDQHHQQLSSISDIGSKKTSKEEKIAAIVTFAARKREDIDEKITVPPKDMAGAAGCAKRYAYDLIDELHEDEDYPWASDASKRDVHLEQDKPERGLLIDFAKTSVQHDGQPLNKFNNETSGNGGE